jgi:dynein heavy chain
VAVLREVHYLNIRGRDHIPESASSIYKMNETLRQYVANLDLTVQWYNKVRESVLEVEFPLIEGQLQEIDVQLEKAEKELNWNSESAWAYIQETRDKVHDLEQRVQKTKDNVEQIQKLMATWSKLPLFERKEGKNESLLNLDDREERLKKRYDEIEKTGEKIHGLLNDNLELFKANNDTDIWRAYVDYVDEMVVDGFFSTIHCSLKFLLDNTEGKTDLAPLFEAHLELQVPEMIFAPSLDFGVADGFYDIIDGLIGDIYKQASKIKRLASHSGQEHYQVLTRYYHIHANQCASYFQPDLEETEELSEMRNDQMDRVQSIMNKACEYRNSYENYAYLWVDDRNEFMRQFLLYNHVLTTEEIEAHAEDGVPECPPTLDQFKDQVF